MANFVICKIYFNKADQKTKENIEPTVEDILLLTTIIIKSLQWVRLSTYMSHFLDQKTDAQEHETFLRPHTWEVAELELEPGKVKAPHPDSKTKELAIMWLGNQVICWGKMQS